MKIYRDAIFFLLWLVTILKLCHPIFAEHVSFSLSQFPIAKFKWVKMIEIQDKFELSQPLIKTHFLFMTRTLFKLFMAIRMITTN